MRGERLLTGLGCCVEDAILGGDSRSVEGRHDGFGTFQLVREVLHIVKVRSDQLDSRMFGNRVGLVGETLVAEKHLDVRFVASERGFQQGVEDRSSDLTRRAKEGETSERIVCDRSR